MVIPKGFLVSVDVKLGSTGTNPGINASVSRRNDEIKVVIDKPGKVDTMFGTSVTRFQTPWIPTFLRRTNARRILMRTHCYLRH